MMDEKKKNQAQDVVRLEAQEMENEIMEMSEEELEKATNESIQGADKELLEMFMKMMKGMLGDE